MNYYVLWKNETNHLKHKTEIYYLIIDLSGIQKFIFQDFKENKISNIQKRSEDIEYIINNIHKIFCNTFKDSYINVTHFGGKIECILKKDIHMNEVVQLLEILKNEILIKTNYQIRLLYAYASCYFLYSYKKNNLYIKLNKMKEVHFGLYRQLEEEKYHQSIFLKPLTDFEYFYFKDMDKDVYIDDYNHAVALKFDLDNLGHFLSLISEVDEKNNISNAIQKIVKESVRLKELTLIFAGGDDIFLVCDYVNVYFVVNHIYVYLKNKFRTNTLFDKYDFSLSLGIYSYNAPTSMVYISQNSEEQLEMAKSKGKNCVVFDDIKLSWRQIEELNMKVRILKEQNIKIDNLADYEYIMENF